MKRVGSWWISRACLVFCIGACEERTSPVSLPSATPPSAQPNPSVERAPRALPELVQTQVSRDPPLTFDEGHRFRLWGGVPAGCEAALQSGWLRLKCQSRNSTGGRPLAVRMARAAEDVVDTTPRPAPTGQAAARVATGSEEPLNQLVRRSEDGLEFLARYARGDTLSATLRWTNTEQVLSVEWPRGAEQPSGKFSARTSSAVVQTCGKLRRELEQLRVDTIRKHRLGDGALKLAPRLGSCNPSGLGAWVLSATALEPSHCPEASCFTAQLELFYVQPVGDTLRTSFGEPVVFESGKLSFTGFGLYDYDDDGINELHVGYELEGAGRASNLSTLWTHDGARVFSYSKAPGADFVASEQLDGDGRPDLGSYGPFVASLPRNCGPLSCPERLVGPRFFARADAQGGFSLTDPVALQALKRACARPPNPVVARQGKLVVRRTAMNIACARVYNVPTKELAAALDEAKPDLCAQASSCPLLDTLRRWASAQPPVQLPAETR